MNRQTPPTTKQSKGLIRSLSRGFARDDKSPQVVRKTGKYQEPTICERCGSIFLRKTWRAHFQLSAAELARAKWSVCPACVQVSREEGQGRVLIRGSGALQQEETIRRRIQNVAGRATRSQPQRRVASIDWVDSGDGRALQVITTSQKLAHRIVHELNKLFRGATSYSWGDDGTLFATWEYELPKPKKPKAAKPKKSPPPKKRAGR